MNRLDLPYVLVTACVGIALFGAGRWTAPTAAPVVVRMPDAPIVTAVREPIPPPPPAVTVDRLPVYTEASAHPAPLVGLTDALTPILTPTASASARPAPSAVAAPKAPAPLSIVLEEIPDNPYKHTKRAVAQTPGF